MISLLIYILVLLLIFGLVWYVIGLIPLPPPFASIAQIVLLIVFVLILISLLLPLAGLPPHWVR